MFKVNFQLRYKRRGKMVDYTMPASIVFFVNINGLLSTPRSTGIKVLKDNWDNNAQKIIGSSEDVQLKNRRLYKIKSDLDALEQELSITTEYLTSQHLIDVYVGKKQKNLTVLKAFDDLLEYLQNPDTVEEALKPKSYAKWVRARELVEDFLISQKQINLAVIHFTLPVAERYRRFLTVKYKFGKDHTSRNISYLSTAFQRAKKQGLVAINPIFDVELPRNRPKKPEPLHILELQRLIDFRSEDMWLQYSADIAIFLCFTGLDYCDYVRFDSEKHLVEIEGIKAIRLTRQKLYRKGNVPEPVTIPLLPEAASILGKYDYNLPLLKYDTIRKQLKIIMSNIRVKKNITLKNLRKTCGTYLLNKGVKLEVIRDVLGHDTIAMTEKIYTIVYPETIIKEFEKLLKIG
ncbi:tyrosine-type recombinase/integrase [Runella zeae]|uniref:tyrosine-type recombinase/integrase n=1 Tax=Runella zeae TaxID=94255 RepID=UPI00048E4E79|nr:site-specific integrase [Runella zeae]